MPSDPKRTGDAARPASNRLFLKISGRRLRAYSIVKHIGRRSGRAYVTPVSAYPWGDGFVITILYGLDSQWVRNVLATGRLTLVTKGREHAPERPELIPATQAMRAYPRWQRWGLRRRGVEHFLWAHENGADADVGGSLASVSGRADLPTPASPRITSSCFATRGAEKLADTSAPRVYAAEHAPIVLGLTQFRPYDRCERGAHDGRSPRPVSRRIVFRRHPIPW